MVKFIDVNAPEPGEDPSGDGDLDPAVSDDEDLPGFDPFELWGHIDGTPYISQKRWLNFLHFLALTDNVTESFLRAGIGRKTVFMRRKTDPDFADAWEEAKDMGADRLEREARVRATRGRLEPLVFQGFKTGHYVRRYSDTLLIFLLKGTRPDKFRDRFEHIGDGAPVTVVLSSPTESDRVATPVSRSPALLDRLRDGGHHSNGNGNGDGDEE